MMKSLSAVGLAMIACAACASAPSLPGRGAPEGPPPPVGPQVFVSPFGEPYQSQPGEPYPVAAWFATADTDGDGKLSQAEFTADGLRFFTALDANQDDVIGQQEIVAYEAMTARLFANAGMRGFGGPNGPGGGPGGRPRGPGDEPSGSHAPEGLGLGFGLADTQDQDGMSGPPPAGPRSGGRQGGGAYSGPRGGAVESSMLAMAGLLNVPEPVKAADVDINQRVTPQEWDQAGQRWFRLLDTDHDGFLTLAELPQTALQRGGGRGGPRPMGPRRGPPD